MGLKRLLLLVALATGLSLGVVSDASAGNFDEPRMGCTGEDPAICPTGTTGTPYSLPIELGGDEDEQCAVFTDSGGLPPGLSITRNVVNETGYGLISGTPTQAGTFTFYLTVTYNREVACPFKNPSDDRFTITVVPGLAKLTIGPESAAPGTAGAPYSLQMTASVQEPKAWSVTSGTLPPGLSLNASTGLISGTPMTAGSFPFQVTAKMASDSRSDSKWLTIEVRPALAIAASTPLELPPTPTLWEVRVPFSATLTASGGNGTYAFSLAGGSLPTGLVLSPTGTISGTPTVPGVFRAVIRLADTEGRTLDTATTFRIAQKLAISTLAVRPGKVGRIYSAKLSTKGGVKPVFWKLTRGKLPKGVRLDKALGRLFGVPKRPGVYRVTFQATDALGVTATRTLRLVVTR